MSDYEVLRDAATNEAYHGPVLCAGTRRSLSALFREIDRRAQQKLLRANVVSGAHYAAMREVAAELELSWRESWTEAPAMRGENTL